MQKGKCEIVEGEKSNEKYQTFLEPTFVMKNINNKANIKKCLLKALIFLQYLVFGSSHLCYRNNLKMVKKGTCLTYVKNCTPLKVDKRLIWQIPISFLRTFYNESMNVTSKNFKVWSDTLIIFRNHLTISRILFCIEVIPECVRPWNTFQVERHFGALKRRTVVWNMIRCLWKFILKVCPFQ